VAVSVKEVKWNQDNDLDNAPVLGEEELEALKGRMLAMDKLLAEAKKAKYKIELMFGSRYASNQPYPGALSLWESGAKLHGGGDTKVYECPGKSLKRSDCTSLIPDASQGYGHLFCPGCKTVWKGSQVHGEVFARLSNQGWATLLYRYFTKLGHNADIYVKRPRRDIRVAARAEQHKTMMGELLEATRKKREVFIYPLKNIIKDVNAGADPVKRFRALLSA
jgi:hypothetical protein